MPARLPSLALLLSLILCAAAPGPACAASWPLRPVTLVVPFSAGGESDTFYTLARPHFNALTKQDFAPRHQSGQGGAQAWAQLDPEKNDGYTLTGVNLPHLLLRSHQADSGVDMREMAVCAIFSYTPCALWVPEESPFKTLDDFINAARKAPGTLLVAGPGSFSAGQLAALALDRLAGVRATYIPYAGTVEAAQAARKGEARAFWAHSVPPAGAFRALAVAAKTRLPNLPAVPTFAELDYDLEEGAFRGLAVPQNTPPEVQKAIHGTFARLAAQPELRAEAQRRGFALVSLPLDALPAFVEGLDEAYKAKAEDYGLLAP